MYYSYLAGWLNKKTRSHQNLSFQKVTCCHNLIYVFKAPLLKLFHTRNKQPGLTLRSYLDDELLILRAQKEELGVKMIESAFTKVEKWANKNGMIFDSNKFETIYFSQKKSFS